jgi:DNA processing protein
MVLFVRGKADLNAQHAISIVGTRQCTTYGKDCINRIVDDMAEKCPDVHIVSGLAYGVDITAHRAAMRNGFPTIGVVAHGQGTLYPAHHRNEANKMVLGNGAVITEFFHDVFPEARNFLQRNRIIAGMSDATLIPESAIHGGGMVTARLAIDYNRELFAIPGSITSPMSEGPNALIRDNKAMLVTSTGDIVKNLGWHTEEKLQQARKKGIERELFTDFTDDERKVVEVLQKGDQTKDTLCVETGLPISTLSTAIFTLEMKGIIRALSGSQYHLIA